MRNYTNLSRRKMLGFTAAAVAILPLQAVAFSKQMALLLINQLVEDINLVAGNGLQDRQARRKIEDILRKYTDMRLIAQSSLGVAWRTASDTQKAQFTEVFAKYLAGKYLKIFSKFKIEKVGVSETRKVTTGYVVSSHVYMDGGSLYLIEWQVAEINGREKLINLVVEGMSMLATERQEITSMLDDRKGNLDTLIADLSAL